MRDDENARLAKIGEDAKKLLVIPITDKKGYEAVHAMQMKIAKERIEIQKSRLAFTAPLDEQKKYAIDVEKELLKNLEVEDELKAKKLEYEKEQDRLKEEEKRKEQETLQARIDEITKYGVEGYTVAMIGAMSDEGFRILADTYKKKYEDRMEQARIEEEKKQRIQGRINRLMSIGMYINPEMVYCHDLILERITLDAVEEYTDEGFNESYDKLSFAVSEARENLRKQREENDRKAQENADKEQALKDEQKKIDDAKAEEKRKQDIKDAEEKAREEERKRVQKEKDDKEEEERQEQARLAKQERYKKWLVDNGCTPETDVDDQWYIAKDGAAQTIILYRKVAVFQINE